MVFILAPRIASPYAVAHAPAYAAVAHAPALVKQVIQPQPIVSIITVEYLRNLKVAFFLGLSKIPI